MQTIIDWVETLNSDKQSLFTVTAGLANNKKTLFMAPYGSKLGLYISERSSILRDELIKLLESFNYKVGGRRFDYVEIGYGELGQSVTCGN